MSAKVPNVVAVGSFIGFTGNLGSTSIFTAPADGLYRLNFYQESAAAIHFTVQAQWQDDSSTNTANLSASWFGAKFGSMAVPLRLKSGAAISIGTINAQPTDVGSIHYSLESL